MESPAGPLPGDAVGSVDMTGADATATGAIPAHADRLATRAFGLVIAGTSGAWLAHGVALWAIAPLALDLGLDPAFGGLLLAVVSVGALVSRFVVGPQVDRHGGRLPAIVGAAVLVGSGLAYGMAASFGGGGWAVLLLGLGAALEGFGFGAMTTSSFAIVGDVVPVSRRGEGVGYFGALQPIVQGLAATLSFALVGAGGFGLLYATVAAAAAISVALFAALRPGSVRRSELARSWRAGLLGREIVVPVVACGTLSFVGGALVLTVPVLGFDAGITNPGVFYLANAVSGVAARLVTGRLSDRWGRSRVAVPGLVLLAGSLVALVAGADAGLVVFVITGAAYGLAAAVALPALQALLLDRTPAARRGASSAAMGIAFDIGFGVGSVVIGAVVSVAGAGAGLVVAAAAPVVASGLLVLDARPAGRAR